MKLTNMKKTKKCMTKGCSNPVIDDGNLCDYCKAKKSVRNKKIKLVVGGTLFTVLFGLLTGIFKKGIMLVVKIFRFIR